MEESGTNRDNTEVMWDKNGTIWDSEETFWDRAGSRPAAAWGRAGAGGEEVREQAPKFMWAMLTGGEAFRQLVNVIEATEKNALRPASARAR